MKTHKDLIAWQKSIDLVVDIYEITKQFPQNEIYGLISQIRRSVISIPSNIAEGAGRKSNKELLYFLNISLGSLSELETQIIISNRLNYINEDEFMKINEKIQELFKIISGLKNSLKSNS